jgi:glycosyltransferase involved in cell wall biosynthesis
LRELRTVAPDLDVVVIDDGSIDDTAQAARLGGAELVTLPFNVGVGGAVRAGLRYAERQGYQRAVVLDADGQHDASSIRDLLGALDAGADMAVGSRFASELGDYGVTRLRKRAMRFLSFVVRVITGQRFTDTTSGFRAFDREVIELLARDYPAEYLADTVEALLLVLYAGHRVVEVATPMRPRAAGRPSTRRLALVANYLRLLIGILGSASHRARRTPPKPSQ